MKRFTLTLFACIACLCCGFAQTTTVPDGETDITTLDWVNNGQDCTLDFNNDEGATIFGTDAGGSNLSYVDLSDYGVIKLYGPANQTARLFLNRAEFGDNGIFFVEIGEDGVGTFDCNTVLEKQPKAQYIHLNGVKASAWNTHLNLSLITASGDPIEFPTINFELAEGEVDLTTLEWVNEGQDCINNLGLDTDATVYGTDAGPADGKLSYVDITDYKTLTLYGRAGDKVRLFVNRAENPDNFQFYVDLDENGIGSFDIAKVYSEQEGAEYVHLNGIKMQWGTPEGKVKIELVGLTEKDFELPEGETDLTTLEWVNEGQSCDNRIGEETDATIYGTHDGPADGNLSYIDITNYTTLKLYGRATDVVRCFINRAEYSDATFQFYITIGEDGVGTLDLADVYAAQEGAEYVHLNGIKTAATWQGSPTGKALVKAITLEGAQGETEPEPIYTAVGHATRCSWTGPNFAPAEDITVESYDGYIVLKNWGGTEGYDLKVTFDAEGVVTSANGLYEGKDYTDAFDGSVGVWTGSDEYYYAYIYLDRCSWAYDEDGQGYVCLNCYAYDLDNNGSYIYYYVQWPLTAEELTEQITAAYDADVATVQEWTDALAQLEEEYPFFSNVEELNAAFAEISQDIQSNYEHVAQALEAANHDWAYESPFTGVIVSVMNEKIIAAMTDCEEILKAINEGYEADLAKIEAYKAELDGLTAGVELSDESAKVADAIYATLKELASLVDQARALAVNETGVYVSPLNEEAIATVDSMFETFKTTGISAIEAEAEGAIYFGITGQQIQKPAAGQTVIKVINGKATKVLVK